jgi:hypothetical protein
MTALASTNSTYKRQTRPLVRGGAPHQQTRKCLTVIKIWSWAPDGCLTSRQTGRRIVGRNITLTLTFVCLNTTFQRMRFMDHVTLYCNNNMSKAAVFLDIKKASDTIWNLGLLYKLSKLQFSISLIHPILTDLGSLRLIVHWTDGTSPSSIM